MRVIKGEIIVEVETEEELQIALAALGHPPIKNGGELAIAKPKNLLEFFRSLNKHSNQYKLLLALRDKPEGMIDDDLCSLLGSKGGSGLGGTLGALTKLARKVGLSQHAIIKSGWRQDKFYYQLTDEMLDALKGIK
jgi:hypothetical protein